MRVFAHNRSDRLDRPEEATEPTQPTTTRRAHRRAIGAARVCADLLTATPKARQRRVRRHPRHRRADRRPRRSVSTPAAPSAAGSTAAASSSASPSDRALPIAIALIVVAAASVSLAPASPVGAAQGGTAGRPRPTSARSAPGRWRQGRCLLRLRGRGLLPGADRRRRGVDDGTFYKPVAVDTTIQTSAGMLRHYTVKEGDTLTEHRQPLRRLDDDRLVGQQADLEGRAQGRPRPGHPAGQRARRDGQGRRHARVARRGQQDHGGRDRRHERALGHATSSSARCWSSPAPRARRCRPRSQPPSRRRRRRRRRRRGGGWWRVRPDRRPVGLASARRLHQPVLPLRPLRRGHRRTTTAARSSRRAPAPWSSPAGRATAVATRSGSTTATGSYSAHHHMSAVLVSAGDSWRRASASGASARAAGPPGRTTTSRSGSASHGRAASYRVNPLRYY